MQDLNQWVGYWVRGGTGVFGITGENDNERRIVNYFSNKGLYVSMFNIYLKAQQYSRWL